MMCEHFITCLNDKCKKNIELAKKPLKNQNIQFSVIQNKFNVFILCSTCGYSNPLGFMNITIPTTENESESN